MALESMLVVVAQQMDPAIAGISLIVSNAEVSQIAKVSLSLLDGDNSAPDPTFTCEQS
jgi:hypothetical protein